VEHLESNASYERSARFDSDRSYWNAKFASLPEMTVLKPQKTSGGAIRAKRKTMITPLKLSRKIREFCSENSLSVFTLFMSALAIYINRVTGNEDIVLGTTILNRTTKREKETSGMFCQRCCARPHLHQRHHGLCHVFKGHAEREYGHPPASEISLQLSDPGPQKGA
jgi:hypothetical protein